MESLQSPHEDKKPLKCHRRAQVLKFERYTEEKQGTGGDWERGKCKDSFPPPSNERTWCKFVSKVVVWCRMYLCLEQVNRHTVFVLICQSSNKAVCVSIAQTQLNEQ